MVESNSSSDISPGCLAYFTAPKIKEITIQEIKDFFDVRMVYRKQYFENNTDIKNSYQFARKVGLFRKVSHS